MGENSPVRRELDALAKLQIGELSGPISTFLGYVLVERTPVVDRQRYGVALQIFPFEPTDTATQAAAYDMAAAVLSDKAGLESPGIGEEHWFEGRGGEGFTRAVRPLKIGQRLAEPLLSGGSYVALKRIATRGDLPSIAHLPAPRAVDVEYWLPHLKLEELGALKSRLAAIMIPAMNRSLVVDDASRLYDEIHDRLEKAWNEHSRTGRPDAVAQALWDIRSQLGLEVFEEYRKELAAYLGALLLNP